MFRGRGKNKIQGHYLADDIYKAYKEEYKDNRLYNVDKKIFNKINFEFYKDLSDYLLDGGLYKFPFGLGELSITSKRCKKLSAETMPIDWKATSESGKIVRHFNDHSNYSKFRFTWSKQIARLVNKSEYRLVPCRANKRSLAKRIFSGDYNFFESK